jgi:hypothetical protein
MILGAPDKITVVGQLVRRQDEFEDWLVKLGHKTKPLWLHLLPYEGRKVRMEWVVGSVPIPAVTQEGRLDFSQQLYEMKPKGKSRRIPEDWRRQHAILMCTPSDLDDPNVLTVHGYGVKKDGKQLVQLGDDASQTVDLRQLLEERGWVGVPLEVRIVSESVNHAWSRARLKPLGDGLQIGGTPLSSFFTQRYSINEDREPTTFTFRRRAAGIYG